MQILRTITLLSLVALASTANAKTANPIDMVVSGAYTYYVGVSITTELFLDRQAEQAQKFWVRVTDDPGTPPPWESGGNGIPLPKSVYIKYFPMSRWTEIRKTSKRIKTLGVVDPYPDGFVMCDGPNTTIRLRKKEVVIAYNCGSSNSPTADAATFDTEDLLKALSSETVSSPDMQYVGTLGAE